MRFTVVGADIPNNQALTGEIDLGHHNLVAIEIPTTWAGTTITFQSKSIAALGTASGGEAEVWRDVIDDTGTEVSVTVAANRIVVIGTVTKAAIGALRFLRIRSGTSATPTNQSPTKNLRLVLKGY